MFPVAGKTASDIDRAASTVKSKMAAMIAEQYIIRTVTTQNNAKKKKIYISSGITWRAENSKWQFQQ